MWMAASGPLTMTKSSFFYWVGVWPVGLWHRDRRSFGFLSNNVGTRVFSTVSLNMSPLQEIPTQWTENMHWFGCYMHNEIRVDVSPRTHLVDGCIFQGNPRVPTAYLSRPDRKTHRTDCRKKTLTNATGGNILRLHFRLKLNNFYHTALFVCLFFCYLVFGFSLLLLTAASK